MERIVPVKDLAAVLEQLYAEGYDSIVVVPLTLREVKCYAQPKFYLGGDSIYLDNESLVVKEYHVMAHKKPSLWKFLFR